MTSLPIVRRELIVAARKRATYWSRVGLAAIALGLSAYVFVLTRAAIPAQLGQGLLSSLAGLAFLHCLLAGVRLTSDAISEEKREGTLGLLFLTDLRGYDVVLGKLAASSLSAFYGLMAIFPLLTVPLLFGGVTGRQMLFTALALLNTLFFSLSVGILVSAVMRRARLAGLLTGAGVLGVAVGIPGLAALGWFWWQRNQTVPNLGVGPPQWLFYPSPAYALACGMAQGTVGNPFTGYWISMALGQSMGWLCLAGASWILPRVWQDRPASASAVRGRRVWQHAAFGSTSSRKRFRDRLLSINPMFWLAARDRLQPARVWGLLGVFAAFWLWGYLYQPDMWQEAGGFLITSLLLHGGLKFWMGTTVVTRLAEDKRSGALELILATPLRVADIARGQRQALWRQFGLPVVAVLVADLLLARMALRYVYSDRAVMISTYAALMFLLALDAVVIARLGPWLAVASRHPSHAAAGTLLRVLVVPWIAFILWLSTMQILAFQRNFQNPLKVETAMAVWFGIAVAVDVFLLGWAVWRMRRDFRAKATERFLPTGGGLWRKLLRLGSG
jgi:ABC-type transport system involved in cytochrome c biogenesis permease component